MQVDRIKPTLKSPGTKRLKLECDKPLSNFALNFNLRRYTKAESTIAAVLPAAAAAIPPAVSALAAAVAKPTPPFTTKPAVPFAAVVPTPATAAAAAAAPVERCRLNRWKPC